MSIKEILEKGFKRYSITRNPCMITQVHSEIIAEVERVVKGIDSEGEIETIRNLYPHLESDLLKLVKSIQDELLRKLKGE